MTFNFSFFKPLTTSIKPRALFAAMFLAELSTTLAAVDHDDSGTLAEDILYSLDLFRHVKRTKHTVTFSALFLLTLCGCIYKLRADEAIPFGPGLVPQAQNQQVPGALQPAQVANQQAVQAQPAHAGHVAVEMHAQAVDEPLELENHGFGIV